jgi:uncharacterized membrane protein YidH (DUF202 family)
MNNTIAQTGAVTFSAVTLEPYVQWALDGFHGSAPSGLALLLAAGGITAVHALGRWANVKWFSKKEQPVNA